MVSGTGFAGSVWTVSRMDKSAVSPKNRLCVDGALEGEHTFTKTGRQRRAIYTTICQWIVDARADITVSTVVQAFTKAGIITELPGNSSDTDSDNDEREPACWMP